MYKLSSNRYIPTLTKNNRKPVGKAKRKQNNFTQYYI